jgi:hypothetical protein
MNAAHVFPVPLIAEVIAPSRNRPKVLIRSIIKFTAGCLVFRRIALGDKKSRLDGFVPVSIIKMQTVCFY